MFYGSNLHRKDNPRWVISNATATPKVPAAALRLLPPAGEPWDDPVGGLGGGLAARMAHSGCDACGIAFSWLIGLPRRAGARLHAVNDAEARWWRWQVSERWGGLVRQYRDARFALLAHNPGIRRDELSAELADPDSAPPDCPCLGDR